MQYLGQKYVLSQTHVIVYKHLPRI